MDSLDLGEKYYNQGSEQYFKDGNTDGALKSFRAAAAAGYEPACGEIGSILLEKKEEPERAEIWFRKVHKIDFLSPMAQYDFGVLLYNEQDDWESALPLFSKAAEAEYVPAYQAIGMIHFKEKHEVDEAEVWFEKAKEAGFLWGAPALYYGMILEFERGIEGMADLYMAKALDDLHGAETQENSK